MKRRIAGLACAVTFLAGCGGSTSTNTRPIPTASVASSSHSPPPASSPAGTPTSRRSELFVIHIRNFAYVPPAPVVAVGQRIEIINDDAAAHTWSAAPKSGWTYTSGNLEKGQHTIFPGFTKPGRYAFLCYYHAEVPSMNGVITVTAG